MDTRTAFALLGVPPTASVDDVRDAYRDLVKVWHPDRFGADPPLQAKATERMRQLNDAYRVAFAHASGYAGLRDRPRDPGPRPAAPPSTGSPAPAASVAVDTHLSFDTIWRTLFWAGVCGTALFVFTAPEGFFALSRGRSAREPRPSAAAVSPYYQLDEDDFGDADLLSRVRGTWVVVENGEGGAWLPAGAQLDVQRGRLSCRVPAPCDATFQANGASRLRIRGAAPADARDVEVWFAGPTRMVWLVRSAGASIGKPLRLVLHAQGEPAMTPVPGP